MEGRPFREALDDERETVNGAIATELPDWEIVGDVVIPADTRPAARSAALHQLRIHVGQRGADRRPDHIPGGIAFCRVQPVDDGSLEEPERSQSIDAPAAWPRTVIIPIERQAILGWEP